MDYQLPPKWIDYLKEQPERGMGYQIVDIYLTNEKKPIKEVIISNASDFKLDRDNFDTRSIEDIVLVNN